MYIVLVSIEEHWLVPANTIPVHSKQQLNINQSRALFTDNS